MQLYMEGLTEMWIINYILLFHLSIIGTATQELIYDSRDLNTYLGRKFSIPQGICYFQNFLKTAKI